MDLRTSTLLAGLAVAFLLGPLRAASQSAEVEESPAGNVDESLDEIKVDVQGAESFVLRGLRETLAKHRPKLVVEYHDYADLEEFLSTLESVGYSRTGRDVDEPSNAPTSQLLNGRNYEFPPRD